MSTSGISPSFLGLSRSSGQITHVLLTRSRLCPRASPGSSHHLHVLSTPPAFVLSQDQTLREMYSVLPYFSESLSCLHGRRVHKYDDRHDEVNQNHPARWRTEWVGLNIHGPVDRAHGCTLLSFQRPLRLNATGLVASQTPGPRKEAPEGLTNIALGEELV